MREEGRMGDGRWREEENARFKEREKKNEQDLNKESKREEIFFSSV